MKVHANQSDIRDAILSGNYKEQAVRLKCYYCGIASPEKIGPFTGAHFDSFKPETRAQKMFTSADLYAVSALSVTVPPKAGFTILDKNSGVDFNELLRLIDNEIKIEDISSRQQFDALLGPDSAATKLWDLLCRNNKGDIKWDVGATTASKILHRKRPHLIPIYDSVIRKVIKDKSKTNWQHWWEALAGDDGHELRSRADGLREEIGKKELSTLRILDVILWMDPQFNSRAERWEKTLRRNHDN